jgi:hypothetical protein
VRPGHETDHSPPSSAEVKNEYELTSSPPLRQHGVLWYCFALLHSGIHLERQRKTTKTLNPLSGPIFEPGASSNHSTTKSKAIKTQIWIICEVLYRMYSTISKCTEIVNKVYGAHAV